MRISTSQMQQDSIKQMMKHQTNISKLQNQISSGSRLLSASDDPIDFARASNLERSINQVSQYQRNADLAEINLSRSESILGSFTNLLQRVRELAIQANNATQSSDTRSIISVEIRQLLDEGVNLANSRDQDGSYIFSGYQDKNKAFIQNPDSSFSYKGDRGFREIQISSENRIKTNDTGSEIFAQIKNGNGSFLTSIAQTNSGTGSISTGNVYDSTLYNQESYRIDFLDSNTYNITNITTLTLIVSGQSYLSGAEIDISGLRVSIKGSPEAGDSFTLSQSKQQDVFTTIQQLADLIDGTTTISNDPAQFQTAIERSLSELDIADSHLVKVRASLGSRLNTIEIQRDLNDAHSLQLKETSSLLKDLDYADATGKLSLQLTVLEAAQQAFVRLQNLSLFRFLS